MFKHNRTILIVIFILAVGLFLGRLAMAQDLGISYANNLGLANADPRVAAVNVIKIALTFLGIIAVVMVLYGGFLWMTAAGDPGRVEKAKKVLLSAIIGLIIILASFLIVQFIFNKISGALTGGSCTVGTSRPCNACEGPGTQTCIAGGVWDTCDTACSGLENCCSFGCFAGDCATPPEFFIKATSPHNGDVGVVRNAVIKYTFNRSLDQTTVDNSTFYVEDITGAPVAIPGILDISARRIKFTPDSTSYPCDPNPCGAESCFATNSVIRIAVDDTAGGILSFGDGMAVRCATVGEPCVVTFTVGDVIDCEKPTLNLDLPQLCAAPGNTIGMTASDDSGITNIEFYSPEAISVLNPLPLVNNPFNTSITWDGSAFPANNPITFQAEAFDMDANSRSVSRTVTLRPGHCCNDILDTLDGETGVDCGGECAACEGAACGVSLSETCGGAGDPNCDDSKCASGFCNCGNYGTIACQDKGYDAAVGDNCCVCEDAPIIDWITPAGGFCDGSINTACLNDTDCAAFVPATCNTETPNGASGNFATIGGRNFGNLPGQVYFSDASGNPTVLAPLANDAANGNPNCGTDSDMWRNRQIIVVVPPGAAEGPIEVIEGTTGNNFSDISDSGLGPVLDDFIINNITRPGLCSTTPEKGYYDDPFNLQGKAFNGTVRDVYFGNNINNTRANNVTNWTDTSVDATVPNVSRGRTSIFAQVDSINSNNLDFRVLSDTTERPVIDYISPASGTPEQYITIYGSRFGTYDSAVSQVLFDDGINPPVTADGNDFPKECRGRWWQDTYIIVKVPGVLVANNYNVTVTNRSALTSDSEPFTVEAGTPGPGLCLLDPTNGPVNQAVTVYGDNFKPLNAGSLVRFSNNKDDTAFGSGEWTNQKILSQVPAGAITGPVTVSDGASLGNSLPFRVGYCNDDSECQTGNECCGSGTFWQGICRLDGTCSGTTTPITGFGWTFTTATTGPEIGTPCFQATTSPLCASTTLQDCSASSTLACSPYTCSCQKPCGTLDVETGSCSATNDLLCDDGQTCDPDTCFCRNDNPLSCAERGAVAGNCPSGEFCGNSPGQCSFYDNTGGATTTVGVACNDASCDSVGNCGGDCTYDLPTNSCIDNGQAICDLASTTLTTDIMGNPVNAYCVATSSDLIGRWQIRTSMSCPAGWERTSLGSNSCVSSTLTCQLCDSGFSCIDNGGGEGICAASQKICPPNSYCEDGDCVTRPASKCECCCRISEGDADCCAGLECLGECGEDRITDTDTYGSCSGCRVDSNNDGFIDQTEQNLSDSMCNCAGSSGKYCDVNADPNNDGTPEGVCNDCGQLRGDGVECTLHNTVCCVDAKNGDNCTGGAGDQSMVAGDTPDLGYCQYFDCQEPPNQYLCDTASTSGAFSNSDTCTIQCARGTDTCDLATSTPGGDCDGLTCFKAFSCFDVNPFSTDCGFCCCDINNDQCSLLSPGLFCSYANFGIGNCNDPAPGSAPASPDFGVCCGCQADSECGDPNWTGCGNDTCCYSRPQVVSTEPADEAPSSPGEGTICRNAVIKAEFDQPMDLGSFSGNVIVAGDYEYDQCPANTTYLALNGQKPIKRTFVGRIFKKFVYNFIKALEPILPSRLARAYTNPSDHNYCAIKGKVSGINNAANHGVLKFEPQNLLDGDRLYYAIVLGDENLDGSRGVRNIVDIGMNGEVTFAGANTFNGTTFRRAHIWSFRTLSDQTNNKGVCDIGSVEINPSSYLFKTTKDNLNDEVDNDETNNTFDTVRDSDKVFAAKAMSEDGQELSSVTGYSWEWNWSVDNANIVDTDPVNPYLAIASKRLFEAQPKVVDGNTNLHAAVHLTDSTYSVVGDGETGTARVQVFICENPWPPVAADGTWEPWQDNGTNCNVAGSGTCYPTNYELYYCRDQGKTGTYDDLPAIVSSSTIIRGENVANNIIKEAYFFREATPGAGANFTATNTPGAQIGGSARLSWAGVPAANNYKLYWGTSAGNYTHSTSTGNVVSTIIDGLNNGTTYYFNLTALIDDAEGDFFGEVSLLVTDTTPPPTPGGFMATAGDGEATLDWIANSTDTASYEVYYGSAADVYGYSQNIGLDTEVIIAGLTNGHTYYFAVRAVDASGNMSGYATANATPQLPSCGDGTCDVATECASGCSADCGVVDCCGNGTCDYTIGENDTNCNVTILYSGKNGDCVTPP